jgi:hypothetical protein
MDARSSLRVVCLRGQTLASSLERDFPKSSFCVEVVYSGIVCRTKASMHGPDRFDIRIGDHTACRIQGN